MSFLFLLIFALAISVFAVAAVRGVGEWNKNNHSPRLTVPATVVAKRTNVSHHHHHHGAGHVGHTTRSTTYYATFQFASGDRMEMHITGREYGMLVDGDRGDLTFQGTRYLGFVRK
jgi:hypothetical protein